MTQVSVIIPNFNRSGVVNTTVRNVLAQTLRPFEIIVIDDGSTDDSVESLRAEFGDRIRLIEQSNQGPGAARNAGLEVAAGEFVWLMDSDDLSSLNKLEVQVAALQQFEADVAYGPCARVFFEGRTVRLEGPVLQQRPLPPKHDVLTWFMTDWSLVLQQCLFRRSTLDKAGRYRTSEKYGEDGEYFVRVMKTGAKVVFEDQSLTIYRVDSPGKLTVGAGFRKRRIIDWARCLIAMHDHCDSRPDIQRHIGLQIRLWRSLSELQEFCPEEAKLADQVASRIVFSASYCKVAALVSRLHKSLRGRCLGNSWTHAYQAASLRKSQFALIQEIGLSPVTQSCPSD